MTQKGLKNSREMFAELDQSPTPDLPRLFLFEAGKVHQSHTQLK